MSDLRPVTDAVASLRLPLPKLAEVRDAFTQRIREGLRVDGAELAGFPAYLAPPPPGLKGKARVVDWGGTNIRGALVELGGAGAVRALEETVFRSLQLSAEEAFELQADLLAPTKREGALPLGYCFSFPARVRPDGDATLEYWTKEIDIPGVAGQRVGQLLVRALEARGLGSTGVAVLNDTVATLLGGASRKVSDSARTIGLIVGTGFNMAGFFDATQAPKLAALGWSEPMAVNLEAAQFKAPHLSRYDAEVDGRSKQPGIGTFEKAVSGTYLPLLFEAVLPTYPGFDPAAGSRALVELRDKGKADAQQVASALLDRSADLVAAGLAAVAQVYGDGPEVSVLAEGSLFWKVPGYPERVAKTLAALGSPRQVVSVMPQQENINLIGAACAALVLRGDALPHRREPV